jgi:dTDP-4-amino-4,6-dideoxygalactose transaminase
MIGAIDPNMTVLRFYEVNFDLKVRSNQWVSEVTSGDLVIFIDYFGFPYDRQLGLCVKEKGAWVLEDACQALLSREVGGSSDFVIFSPRKFLGVPDGGVLILNRELDFHDIDLVPSPAEWWLQAFCAGVLRREFDVHGGNRRWFELFQQTELTSPIGYYAMSELSKALLMHSFDYSTISQQRIDNYRLLARALADIALFPSLSANIVPLGFPIRVKNRDRLRQVLFDHKIYPPVHWPIRGIVPGKFRDSHKLAGEIMTLPCDQRYDAIDMKRMAELVNEVLEC